ncbi:hypothetical protein NSS89_00885 [Caldifermentibacillus hisashii]|nr:MULTISPECIES: hypothetical protein [Bacillaceae]MEC5272550.1 hypothetical protein [Caldifermentibacillus hisashii]
MGGITKKGEWKGYDYIPFPMLRKQWQTVVLKFIRRYLKKEEKKRIQSRLQKAFSRNGEGFYVCPKTKGEIKGTVEVYWPLYSSTSDWNESY